jgi:WW domain
MSDWECHTAPGTSTPYYYNRTTGVTQWHAPLPLGVEKVTAGTNRKRSNPSRVLALDSAKCDDTGRTAGNSIIYDHEDHEESPKEHGKDYKHMAKEYRIMQKYRDLKGK